jgi:hypothetical protein
MRNCRLATSKQKVQNPRHSVQHKIFRTANALITPPDETETTVAQALLDLENSVPAHQDGGGVCPAELGVVRGQDALNLLISSLVYYRIVIPGAPCHLLSQRSCAPCRSWPHARSMCAGKKWRSLYLFPFRS